jgi:hypothetical protein
VIRFHYHRQDWLPRHRRWQALHFFWPNGHPYKGVGITIWAREFSLTLTERTTP